MHRRGRKGGTTEHTIVYARFVLSQLTCGAGSPLLVREEFWGLFVPMVTGRYQGQKHDKAPCVGTNMASLRLRMHVDQRTGHWKVRAKPETQPRQGRSVLPPCLSSAFAR
jgi:hypothetical protein